MQSGRMRHQVRISFRQAYLGSIQKLEADSMLTLTLVCVVSVFVMVIFKGPKSYLKGILVRTQALIYAY